MKKDDKKLLAAGGLAGFIGSLCCLGPVVIVALGLGGVSTALSLGKYTWLFTSLAILFFGIAVVYYLKRKNSCNAQGVRKNWKILLITFIILVLLLLVLKYWLAPLLAGVVY